MEEGIIIVDTDVIINHVRKTSEKLNKYIMLQAKNKVKLVISTVTVFEYYSGNSLEDEYIRDETDILFTQFIKQPVGDEIAKLAASINRKSALYGTIGLGDLFIASTAIHLGGRLLTANKKHFRLIPNLKLLI